MFLGVLYGILGCSLWGFIYIIPLLLPEYSPATVAMGRFTVYSIGSLVICYYCRKTLALLTTSDWIKAFCLGFFGNAVYYVLLTKGVRFGRRSDFRDADGIDPVERCAADESTRSRDHCCCALAASFFAARDDSNRFMDRQY